MTYDAARRVAGFRKATAPETWFTLAYQTNTPTGSTAGYVAKWTHRTVLAAPGIFTSYSFDNAGQLLAVAKSVNDPMGSGGLGGVWVSAMERDSLGGVVTVRTPAAVSAYLPTATGDAAFFTPGTAGLRYVVDRVSSGLFTGFVRSVKHQASGSAPAFADSWVSYLQESQSTLGWKNVGTGGHDFFVVRPLVTDVRRFSSEQTGISGGSARTTEFAYTFHSSEPLAVKTLTQRDPAVSATEHGPGGTGFEVKTYLEADGEVTFQRSRTGRIHFFGVDPATGLTEWTVQDADTESQDFQGETIPSGFATDTNATGILHRVRCFGYDEMGRMVSSLAPDGREGVSHYAAMADGRVVSLDVPLVREGAFHGPATATVFGLDGELWATMLVGPELANETGFEASTTETPSEWLNLAGTDVLGVVTGPTSGVRGDLVTLQRSASGALVLGSRMYHALPTSGEGAADTNYDPTFFGYDANGRLNRIEDPTRTIEAFEFDALGRLVRHRRGTDDDGSTGNMFLMSENVFDAGNSGGNNLLSQRTVYPGVGSARVTKFAHDARGRVIGVSSAAAPHAVLSYDNWGNVIGMALIGGDGTGALGGADPFASTLSGRVALARSSFDALGRRYEQKQYAVDPTDGSYSEGSGESKTTRYFYSGEGRLRAVRGEKIVKTKYNRACECETVTVVAASDALDTYTEALSVLSTDAVLEETRYIRNPKNGWVQGVLHTTRGTGACAAGGPITDPSQLTVGGDGGFTVGSGYAQNGLGAMGSAPHRVSVSTVWRDDLGRPVWTADLGDPSYGSTGFGFSPSVAFTNDNVGRVAGTHFDALGRVRVAVSPTLDAVQYSYDDAGRVVMEADGVGDIGGPGFGGSSQPYGGVAFAVCDGKGTRQRTWNRGREVLGMAYIPGQNGVPLPKPVQRIFPDMSNDGVYFGDKPAPPVKDNRVPLGMTIKSQEDLDDLLDGPFGGGNGVFLQSTNALGETLWTTDFGGVSTIRTLDDAGRPSRIDFQKGDGDFEEIGGIRFEYDALGRLRAARQEDPDSSNAIGNETEIVYDRFGEISGMTQDVDSAIGASSGVESFNTAFFHSLTTTAGDWQFAQRSFASMPGGMDVASTFGGTCSGSGTFNLDALMGRVTSRGFDVERPWTPGQLTRSPGGPPMRVVEAQNYFGIAFPADKSLSYVPAGMDDIPADPRTIRLQVYNEPSNQGVPETSGLNRYGEPSREMVCCGVSCDPLQPNLHHTTIARDAAGRKTNAQDLIKVRASQKTIYVSCPPEIAVTMGDQVRSYPGMGDSGTGFSGPDQVLAERLTYDGAANVKRYRRDSDYEVASGQGEGNIDLLAGEFIVRSGFDLANQRTKWDRADHTTGETAPGEAFEPVFDLNGNLRFDGVDREFGYDVLNRLTSVSLRGPPDEEENYDLVPFAKFSYDVFGRRTSAVYDREGDGFGDNAIEWYAYDELWRVVAIYVQTGEGTGGAGSGQRPAARCSERMGYGGAGLTGKGDGERFLDCPVLMQIDEDGDGVFERVRRYVQNSSGDVVAVVENPRVYQAGTANELELPTPNLIVRYTAAGEPLLFGEPGADFDQDDDVDSDDVVAFFEAWDNGDVSADVDADQDTDTDDIILFLGWFENGVGQCGTSVGSLRFAFRGYWWDPYLKMYHVRHRVYDPTPGPGGMRWLQRDPAGFVDGWNLYAYCPDGFGVGDPVNGIDPLGLWWGPLDAIGEWLYDVIHDAVVGEGSPKLAAGVEDARRDLLREKPLGPADVSIEVGANYVYGFQNASGEAAELAEYAVVDLATGGGATGGLGGAAAGARRGTGMVDEAARPTQIAKLPKPRPDSAIKGAIGERAADRYYRERGYTKLRSKVGNNQGFDGVYVKQLEDGTEEVVIHESKFQQAGGAIQLKQTKQKGKQMSERWRNETISQMKNSKDPAVIATARRISEAQADKVKCSGSVLDEQGNLKVVELP